MSSLPQGWHCNATASQKSLAGKSEFVSSVPTLRKKWNSGKTDEKPSITPYKRSSMTTLPNGLPSRITPPRSTVKTSSTTALKGQISERSLKPTVSKRDFISEIENLKKDVSTYKSENMVLKSKVRKLEDENGQKSRLLIKLKAEMQSETINQKKNKESGANLLLKQKVLRLESALKEKDQAIKRMVAEMNSIKVDELREILVKYHKQFGLNTNGLGSDFFKKHKLLEPCTGTVPSSSKSAKNNVKDQGSRAQVDKLRNMVHKLESESHTLQQQMKDKDQEIRRLKLQISRQTPRVQTTSLRPLPTSTTRLTTPGPKSATSSQSNLSRSSITRISSSGQIANVRNNRISQSAVCPVKQNKKEVLPKVVSPSCSASPSRSALPINRMQAVPKQKPKVLPGKPIRPIDRSDVERRAQIMRENIAARKIQQGWRNHRKMMSKESTQESEDKALDLLYSELVAHHKRLEKLKFFGEESKLSENETELLHQETRNAFLSLFCD